VGHGRRVFKTIQTAVFCTRWSFALIQASHIDYSVTSSDKDVANLCVLDLDINFSEHLPLLAKVICSINNVDRRQCCSDTRKAATRQLRSDKADPNVYFYSTGEQIAPLLALLNNLLGNYIDINSNSMHNSIDKMYN